MAVYDINDQLAKRRKALADELSEKIDTVDRRIAALEDRHTQVSEADTLLTQLEAVLRRMSMLAREAKKGSARPGLLEEFEQCKRTASHLADKTVLCGVPLTHAKTETVTALLHSLAKHLDE